MIASSPRQAVILAAGCGTRLGRLTDTLPKCMVEVAGRPILEHTIAHLASYGVTELFVNLHHRPDGITRHFGTGARWGVDITYLHEPTLLGTAGTVRALRHRLSGTCVVWYGDNLSHCRLDRMWEAHRAGGATATIAVHRRERAGESGVVVLDRTDRVTAFTEKPGPTVTSALVNAGIYLLDRGAVESIPRRVPCDFGADALPSMVQSGQPVIGYRLAAREGLWWSDRPDDLTRTRATFRLATR